MGYFHRYTLPMSTGHKNCRGHPISHAKHAQSTTYSYPITIFINNALSVHKPCPILIKITIPASTPIHTHTTSYHSSSIVFCPIHIKTKNRAASPLLMTHNHHSPLAILTQTRRHSPANSYSNNFYPLHQINILAPHTAAHEIRTAGTSTPSFITHYFYPALSVHQLLPPPLHCLLLPLHCSIPLSLSVPQHLHLPLHLSTSVKSN